MAHQLERIAASLYNTPLLATQEELERIQDYLSSRNSREDFAIAQQQQAREWANEVPPTVENGIGLLEIDGPLSYRFGFIQALCGLTSYQKLLADFESLVEQGAHTVVLDQNSGGGEAHGVFETAMQMRKIADENNVRIIAYVDGMSGSASYALSSVADEIVMNGMSKVGSVGVVISLVNDLPKKIEEGTEVRFVYSGESKIPYDAQGKLREDFIEGLQKDTDLLYQDFIKHVSTFRPMSAGEVRDTNAKMFRATDAVRMGLADKIMTSFEFMDYLAQLADDHNRKTNQEGRSNMPLFGWGKKKDKEMSAQEDTQELASEAPEASEATPSELLEGNQEGNEELSVESSEKPSKQSKENNEVNMDLEQLLASPEAQAKIKEEAEKQSAAYKEKLAAFEAEKEAAAKASYVELVSGYSFVAKESQEKVATFLFEASEMAMDGVDEIMEALESAKMAVEAVVEEEHGDEGEALETNPDVASKATVSDLIKKRYAK